MDHKETLKETSINYCQVCGKDFKHGEKVYYAPLDNNILCSKCASVHKNKESRIFK